MKLRFFTYQFPFKNPFITAKNKFDSRSGILLKLKKDGINAWGEAAPLPGFSRETLHDVRAQIRSFLLPIKKLFASEFSQSDLYKFYSDHPIFPSLQFGLFSLGCFYLAQSNKISLYDFLFDHSPPKVPLNTVIDLDRQNLEKHVNQLIQQGFKTIKLKADASSPFIAKLKKIRALSPNINIRLDANQSWKLQQAGHFLQKIEPLNIEYCEEPLQHPDANSLLKLRAQSTVPLALDESLVDTFSLSEACKVASVLIIKPMVLGAQNFQSTFSHIAKNHAIKLIFTSSLESGIGRLMTAHLAAGLGTQNAAHGLATGDMLQKDIWNDHHFIQNGTFILPDAEKLRQLMQVEPTGLNLQEIKF